MLQRRENHENFTWLFFLASFMLFSFSDLRGFEIECEDQKCPVLRNKRTQKRSSWIEISLIEEVNQHLKNEVMKLSRVEMLAKTTEKHPPSKLFHLLIVLFYEGFFLDFHSLE